jgi:hypothetical protein
MLITVIYFLLFYWCISNQTVAGSIILKYLHLSSFSFFSGLLWSYQVNAQLVPSGYLCLFWLYPRILFDFTFVSLANWACLHITYDLGLELVLRNGCLFSMHSWKAHGNLIPINDILIYCFGTNWVCPKFDFLL